MSNDLALTRCQKLTSTPAASVPQIAEWFGAVQAQDFGGGPLCPRSRPAPDAQAAADQILWTGSRFEGRCPMIFLMDLIICGWSV